MAKKVTNISLKDFISRHAVQAEDYACYGDMLCAFNLDSASLNKARPMYQRPVRSDFVSFITVESGALSITVGQQQATLTAGTTCICREGSMAMSPPSGEQTKGYVVMFAPQIFSMLHLKIKEIIPHMGKTQGFVVTQQLEERQACDMRRAVDLLRSCIQNDSLSANYNEMVMSLVSYFFYACLEFVGMAGQGKKQGKRKDGTREEAYFKDFMQHLREHYRQERKIGFYADKVCVSAKYLSSIVRSVSGYGPSHWIDGCVIGEAKNLLKLSTMSIQEISNELHFPTQSYFGRYFKKHTGMSPRTYRLS